MEIYVMRHGEAASSAAGESDGTRSLTDRGRRQVAAAAAGLRSLGVAFDRVLASPLRRAQQTAEIVMRELAAEAPMLETVAELDGSAPPDAVLAALGRLALAPEEAIAVVGHMPGLGELVTLATAGVGASGVPLGTASVARIDFEGRPRPGAGRLRWLMSAEQMALLRRGSSDARSGRSA